MIFSPLELSKKLQALGCFSVSPFKHFIVADEDHEASVIKHFSELEDFKDKTECESISVDIKFAFVLEDFVLNNEHCRGNWEKIRDCGHRRIYERVLMINHPEGPWAYLETLLENK